MSRGEVMVATALKREVYVPGLGQIAVSVLQPLPPQYGLLMRQDVRQQFWIGRNWPEDAFGRVFLARAVIRLGEAMFPDEWTGHEPGVNTSLRPLPAFSWEAHHFDARAAVDAVPVAERAPLSKTAGFPKNTINERDYGKGRDLWNLAVAELAAPRARWEAVQRKLRDAMMLDPGQPGAVKYCVLDAPSGDYSVPLPNKWWNTTTWPVRFALCQINLSEPVTTSMGGRLFRHIFVDGADLAALIDSLAPIKLAPSFTPVQKRRAERECAQWLVATYISQSPDKATMTKAEALAVVRRDKADRWPVALISDRAFRNDVFPMATKGFPMWRAGGTAPKHDD